jgi:hypothetical protein
MSFVQACTGKVSSWINTDQFPFGHKMPAQVVRCTAKEDFCLLSADPAKFKLKAFP